MDPRDRDSTRMGICGCTGGNDFLLARFDGQAWWTYDPADMGIIEIEESADDVLVTHIAVDRSGTLWATLEIGKRKIRWLTFNGTQWTS